MTHARNSLRVICVLGALMPNSWSRTTILAVFQLWRYYRMSATVLAKTHTEKQILHKCTFAVTSCFCFLSLQKFEKKYNNELVKGAVSKDTKFEYAWCLIRSKYSDDIKKGIVLLEGEFIKINMLCPALW